jgi:hypothetical protein
MRDELKALRAEVERLRAEVELHRSSAPADDRGEAAPAPTGRPSLPPVTAANFANPPAVVASGQPSVATATSATPSDSAPAKKEKIAPFSDWDWTWLNGNPRTKDSGLSIPNSSPRKSGPMFPIHLRFQQAGRQLDGGSSEIFRSNEIQLEQLGVGGDFHYDNVRARFMTQFGMYSETTPRNDPSPAKGQWDLDTAYRYLAEAYGGYHINALTESTSTRESSCRTLACSATTTSTTGPINLRMFPPTRLGFSTGRERSDFPQPAFED